MLIISLLANKTTRPGLFVPNQEMETNPMQIFLLGDVSKVYFDCLKYI